MSQEELEDRIAKAMFDALWEKQSDVWEHAKGTERAHNYLLMARAAIAEFLLIPRDMT